jgi:hypothetical protein
MLEAEGLEAAKDEVRLDQYEGPLVDRLVPSR